MTPKIDFEFVPNSAGESIGLNDAGIETYKSNPFASLGRECGQNSNDARVKQPVVVDFDVLELPRTDIPGCDRLKAAVEACAKVANERRDEKAVDFFRQARRLLKADKIRIMRVADTNTTGLVGPCVEGTPFHALVKSAGESNKGQNVTSGGSFGIGKNAAYAVSDLRTVFYSTLYQPESGKEAQFLAQGKAKLMSHRDECDKAKLATGYWGTVADFGAVDDLSAVPQWLRRSEIGTSVFALGFRDVPNWQYQIAYSLLVNFFAAIHRGDIQFNVNGGEIKINANSLVALFNDDRVREAATKANRIDAFDSARNFYDCLTSPQAVDTLVEVSGLGRLSIRLLVKESLPKRVGIIRNGMMITESLSHFGDRLDRFPLYNDFVALVEPLDTQGSALIKKLESPRHDELSADYIPDEAKAEAARMTMTSAAKKIRETIRSQTKIQHKDEVAADEMTEFFADLAPANLTPDQKGEPNPEKIKYELKQKRRIRRGSGSGKGAQGGGGALNGTRNESDGGADVGTNPITGTGTSGASSVAPIILKNFRTSLTADQRRDKRQLFFTPTVSGKAIVSLDAPGLNESERLEIISTDKGTVKNGKVSVPLTADQREAICVVLSEPYDGPIEISAQAQGASR
jgi:hypothetical protein